MALGLIATMIVVVFRMYPTVSAIFLLGTAGSVTSVLLVGVPCGDALDIISTKDSSNMPVAQVMAGFVGGVSWTLYGILLGDIFVWLPSFIGLLSSVVQVTLLKMYSNFFSDPLGFMSDSPYEPVGGEDT
jgi:solute carrier family 50 protein (sugar transporter)